MASEQEFLEDESKEDKEFWTGMYNDLYWLQAKKLVPGYDGKDPEDVNILEEVMAAVNGNEWKDTKGTMEEYKDKFFAAQQRVVDDNFDDMDETMNCTEAVIQDYRGMSNLVKSLKQNIRNVKSQTSFNANSIFDTFFTVEKLDEEVRLLKVIEAVYGSRDQYKSLIETRHFVHAVYMVHETIGKLESEELSPIAALKPLYSEMKTNVTQLQKKVIENLKAHIYLTAEACWDLQDSNRSINRVSGSLNTKGVIKKNEQTDALQKVFKKDATADMIEPLNEDTEENSYVFIARCIEALSVLGGPANMFDGCNREVIQTVVKELGRGMQAELHNVITACLIDFQDYTGPESDEFLIMSSVPIDGKESEKETMAAQLHGVVSNMDASQMRKLTQRIFTLFERIMNNFSFLIKTLEFKKDQLEAAFPNMEEMTIFPIGQIEGGSVWSAMQKVLVTFMESYLATPHEVATTHDLRECMKLDTIAFSFTFENPSDMLGEDADDEFYKRPFRIIDSLPASPFFVEMMYESQSDFVRKITSEIKIHCEQSLENPWNPGDGCDIFEFLDTFISDKFFPYVKAEIATYLSNKYKSSEAFKRVSKRNKFGDTYYAEGERGALIDAAAHTMMAIEFLFEGIASVQQERVLDMYMEVIDETVEGLLDAIKWIVRDCVKDTSTKDRLPADPAGECNSGGDPKQMYAHLLLHQDPYMVNYKQRRENEDKKSPEGINKDFNRAFFDDANFQALFTEFQTQQAAFDDNLISSVGPKDQERPGEINVMKPQNIAQLASICTSLNWFADGLLSNLDMKKHSDENARMTWDNKLLTTTASLKGLAAKCRDLADNCILFMRTEMRMLTVKTTQMLTKSQQRRTPKEEPTDVDPNVATLIKELSKRMQPALVFLTPEVGRLLAPQLGFFVGAILRKMLLCITTINEHGATQIINSIYALVSVINMDNYISEDETDAILGMVHYYFNILRSAPNQDPHQDIISDLIEDQTKPNFRLDELEILFKRTNNDHYYGSSNKSAAAKPWDDIKKQFVSKDPTHTERTQQFETERSKYENFGFEQ